MGAIKKIITTIGVFILIYFILTAASKERPKGFAGILGIWGEEQSERSDNITQTIVQDLEGGLVGEHEVDGSNWAIPNILRNILGVE